MSDIFVSYASADRDRAKVVADALIEKGWTAWWDRTIPPGKQFDEVIEEALDSAKCVVVLWSSASVASTWVKTEAAEAMRRKILVPALIEDVKIPLEFRRLQAADLSRWDGNLGDPQLRQFFDSIGAHVSRTGRERRLAASAPEVRTQRARPVEARAAPPLAVEPGPGPPAPGPKRRLTGVAVVAAVAVIAIVGGYSLYSGRSGSTDPAGETRRAAEDQRRAAHEAEMSRQAAEEERRAAEEARRQAAQERRAADEATARANAARESAQREEAERVAAQARLEQARRAAGPSAVNVEWYDNALRYVGSLIWTSNNATLRATVYDLRTGMRIGNYDVPARVSQLGGSEYVVSGDFAVPGDSTTPYPHAHAVQLTLRRQADGSLRFVQNCPRPGECYSAR